MDEIAQYACRICYSQTSAASGNNDRWNLSDLRSGQTLHMHFIQNVHLPVNAQYFSVVVYTKLHAKNTLCLSKQELSYRKQIARKLRAQ